MVSAAKGGGGGGERWNPRRVSGIVKCGVDLPGPLGLTWCGCHFELVSGLLKWPFLTVECAAGMLEG